MVATIATSSETRAPESRRRNSSRPDRVGRAEDVEARTRAVLVLHGRPGPGRREVDDRVRVDVVRPVAEDVRRKRRADERHEHDQDDHDPAGEGDAIAAEATPGLLPVASGADLLVRVSRPDLARDAGADSSCPGDECAFVADAIGRLRISACGCLGNRGAHGSRLRGRNRRVHAPAARSSGRASGRHCGTSSTKSSMGATPSLCDVSSTSSRMSRCAGAVDLELGATELLARVRDDRDVAGVPLRPGEAAAHASA